MPANKADTDQKIWASTEVHETELVDGTYCGRADWLGRDLVTSGRDQLLCRRARLEREGDMRLGKEEARGFIDEPIELAAEQDDSAARRNPAATDPRKEAEHLASVQRSPRNAPEDQPTFAG